MATDNKTDADLKLELKSLIEDIVKPCLFIIENIETAEDKVIGAKLDEFASVATPLCMQIAVEHFRVDSLLKQMQSLSVDKKGMN